jgi:hypothetical protein
MYWTWPICYINHYNATASMMYWTSPIHYINHFMAAASIIHTCTPLYSSRTMGWGLEPSLMCTQRFTQNRSGPALSGKKKFFLIAALMCPEFHKISAIYKMMSMFKVYKKKFARTEYIHVFTISLIHYTTSHVARINLVHVFLCWKQRNASNLRHTIDDS